MIIFLKTLICVKLHHLGPERKQCVIVPPFAKPVRYANQNERLEYVKKSRNNLGISGRFDVKHSKVEAQKCFLYCSSRTSIENNKLDLFRFGKVLFDWKNCFLPLEDPCSDLSGLNPFFYLNRENLTKVWFLGWSWTCLALLSFCSWRWQQRSSILNNGLDQFAEVFQLKGNFTLG